ncbi:MAG: hypothetical protein ACRELX_14220, partial [Longimicrobiales bacterium]
SSVVLIPLFALSVLGAAAVPADAQSRVLRGRLLTLDRNPADGVRIRVVGYGEPVVLRSGEFVQELPADLQAVTIQSVDPHWTVIYPPDARVPVPSGDEVVTIVVGEPVERTITRALAERQRTSDQLLAEYGLQREQLGGVEDGIQRILEKLELREADLRDEVARKERQAEVYPRISAAVEHYVIELRDLVTCLTVVGPLIATDPQNAYESLADAINQYNKAFETLRMDRGGFETSVEREWSDGPLARRDLAGFYDEVIEATHRQHVLPLNDVLVVIQNALFESRRDDRLRQAIDELGRRAAALSAAADVVGGRSTRLLEQLRPR